MIDSANLFLVYADICCASTLIVVPFAKIRIFYRISQVELESSLTVPSYVANV